MTAYSNHCPASISFLAFLATMMVQIWKRIIPIMTGIKTTLSPAVSPPAPARKSPNTMTPKTTKMAYPIHERMAKTIQTRMAVLLRVWAPKIRTQCIITPIIPLIIPFDPLPQPIKLKTARTMPKTKAALTFVAQQQGILKISNK